MVMSFPCRTVLFFSLGRRANFEYNYIYIYLLRLIIKDCHKRVTGASGGLGIAPYLAGVSLALRTNPGPYIYIYTRRLTPNIRCTLHNQIDNSRYICLYFCPCPFELFRLLDGSSSRIAHTWRILRHGTPNGRPSALIGIG